jgi:phage terminase Nu1 subunit (DNA packaging protein)
LDATTIGAVLTCVGVLSGSVVAYIGKRGETRNSLTDQLQEELTAKRTELATAQAEVTALQQQRREYLVRITQLEIENIRLGGNPQP